MSYIALARKWRPRTFSQLVGQDHVTQLLVRSLNQKKLHHAYLFTGTRGVGKTSIARLFAKALNCEQGVGSEPCLSCESCLAIEQGRFIDLIEIDGASKTRVEDTREMLENVQYAPTSGRFKIYLIDEVHMLSQHSFNALLKTLEEPPSHVKFLLATTDPQKLPVTVLSRCLQCHLKHLPTPIIAQQLEYILVNESFSYDKEAVHLVATAARGSMRDALSLLDQAMAVSQDNLQTQTVRDCLGYTQQDYAVQLLDALAAESPERIIHISRCIGQEGGYFNYVLEQLIHYLHQIQIAQLIPGHHPLITPMPALIALSGRFSPEDVQLFYQMALKATEELMLAPTMAIGFEMTLLRMHAFKPATPRSTPLLAHQVLDRTPVDEPFNVVASGVDKNVVQMPSQTPSDNRSMSAECALTWSEILAKLSLQGIARSAAENAELAHYSKGEVVLRVSKGHLSLFTPMVVQRLERALADYYREPIKLVLKGEAALFDSPAQQQNALQKQQTEQATLALKNDPFLQQLQEAFSGEWVKNSIALRKDDL